MVAYDQIAARREMRSDLDVLAEIVGSNSTAAVTFGDRRAAEELLSGLKAKKHIVTAVIYSDDGKPFASYRRDAGAADPRCPCFEPARSRFEGDRLIVYRDIRLASQIAGVIYLESDLGELHERLARFAWTVFLILLISSALAMALSSKLQRAVSEPIAHLAGVAKSSFRPEELHRAGGEAVRRRSRTARSIPSTECWPKSKRATWSSRTGATCWSKRWRRAPRNCSWPRTARRRPAGPRANSWPI